MHIALHGKSFGRSGVELVASLLTYLEQKHIDVSLTSELRKFMKGQGHSQVKTMREFKAHDQADFVFSLGGDGTLLHAVTFIKNNETPILGVNMGRLGFLATISPDELLPAVDQLVNNNYSIDRRVLLKLDSSKEVFYGVNFALNDFTILKRDTSSMIVVQTYVDGQFLNGYWADGLIIATPTGSTGYSLSCGGPLVMPHSHNFVITPVSPHNLNVRPMVVSDDAEITFKIESRSKKVLTSLDSRSVTVPSTTTLMISKEKFSACLIKFRDYHPFETLRQKLNWGLDARN